MARVLLHKDLLRSMGRQAADDLRDEFLEWLRVGEFEHPLFGKDSAFDQPREAVAAELRHVHLIPVADMAVLQKWRDAYRRTPPRRKTSDRVLVYAKGFYDPDAYLLLDILPENPGAHKLMHDHVLVRKYAAAAERFRMKY